VRTAVETLPSVEAYTLWSASYPPRAHNRLMEIEQAEMLRLLPEVAGRDVLDLACGTGRYGLIAQRVGASQVVGVDNSAAMLQRGALRLAVEASMTALPFAAASSDVVMCGLALGHLPPEAMRRAIAEIARVLRRGGTALFSDFHPYLYLRGGRRTFCAPDGTTYAVEHYPHLVADYFAAISAAGMTVTAISEPTWRVDEMEVPAVLVMRCHLIACFSGE
jgi:malonyl-CoA O-methyltransferase